MSNNATAWWFFFLLLVIGFIAQSIIHHLDKSPDDSFKEAVRNNSFKEAVRKVTYEGHEYLIYANRGVCHYPGCKCKTKGD